MTKKQDDSDYRPDRKTRCRRPTTPSNPRRGGYQRQGLGEAVAKSFIRSIASRLGRILVRTITGRIR